LLISEKNATFLIWKNFYKFSADPYQPAYCFCPNGTIYWKNREAYASPVPPLNGEQDDLENKGEN